MRDDPTPPGFDGEPRFIIAMAWYSVLGCVIFAVSILVADLVVPDHDWIADTISDLGAGRYEFIVDIGIYAFSASLIAVALLSAHVHMGGWRWSLGTIGFAILGLIVFLVGARNEYGDRDSEGIVIHSYLVYALAFLMAVVPWLMAEGAGRKGEGWGRILIAVSIVWTLSAPFFFLVSDSIDGLYERYLGLIVFVAVVVLSRFFIGQASEGR